MIRPVTPHDAAAIVEIYNHYIRETVITFETVELTVAEMTERITHISQSFPFLISEEEGRITGYCYLHPWKSKAAYRHTAETTIYLHPEHKRHGTGTALMNTLIEAARAAQFHVLIACITASETASIRFHQSLGFTPVSHFHEVGQKFDHWLDVVDYELPLSNLHST